MMKKAADFSVIIHPSQNSFVESIYLTRRDENRERFLMLWIPSALMRKVRDTTTNAPDFVRGDTFSNPYS